MNKQVDGLAEKQHGVVSRQQVLALGFTPAAVQHRLRTGRWELLRPGIYRLAGSPRTWEQHLLTVVLAAGPGAVASHRSAAALLGFAGFRHARLLDVTTARSHRHRSLEARMHRSLLLPKGHLAVINGVPCTRSARTLIDLAGVLPPSRTERALDNCLASSQTTMPALRTVLADLARPGRPGIALMRRLLDDRGGGYAAPASELEARFRSLVRSAGLPEPVAQHDVGDGERWLGRSDHAYPALRLLIELDSRRHHLSKLDFEADRARDNRRVAAGWRPLRFTWHQVTRRPAEVIDILRRSGVTSHRQSDVG